MWLLIQNELGVTNINSSIPSNIFKFYFLIKKITFPEIEMDWDKASAHILHVL